MVNPQQMSFTLLLVDASISKGHFQGLSKVPDLLFIASKWRYYQKRQTMLTECCGRVTGIFLLSSFTDFYHSLANSLTQRCVHIKGEATFLRCHICMSGQSKEEKTGKKVSQFLVSSEISQNLSLTWCQCISQAKVIQFRQFFYILGYVLCLCTLIFIFIL